MMDSSPSLHFPSTPSTNRIKSYSGLDYTHRPLNSSPLASPTFSSPVAAAQARRRSQYKSKTPTTLVPSSSRVFSTNGRPSLGGDAQESPEQDAQKAFLRARFKDRCKDRLRTSRANAVKEKQRRYASGSSDGFDEAMDEDDDREETDDDVMQDEFFRRLVQNAERQSYHRYRVSYALEVGSSFDPDMEDVAAWENELHEEPKPPSSSVQTVRPTSPVPPEVELTPEELEAAEIEAYAEEAAEQAALAEFEDISYEDLVNWSDEENGFGAPDVDMDMA